MNHWIPHNDHRATPCCGACGQKLTASVARAACPGVPARITWTAVCLKCIGKPPWNGVCKTIGLGLRPAACACCGADIRDDYYPVRKQQTLRRVK